MAKGPARHGPAQARLGTAQQPLGRHGPIGTSCRAVPAHGLHLPPRHGPPAVGPCGAGPKAWVPSCRPIVPGRAGPTCRWRGPGTARWSGQAGTGLTSVGPCRAWAGPSGLGPFGHL
uniref:Uncharacterized protein n=1 Tax=Oryza sativa subsp. japonica TaxID=39947 RepID=Q6K5S2_ORYSJ|nr:hypothetical protein [Oryza sativa Japonica Group]